MTFKSSPHCHVTRCYWTWACKAYTLKELKRVDNLQKTLQSTPSSGATGPEHANPTLYRNFVGWWPPPAAAGITPRLNIKTVLRRYEDSHVKDKTVARPSYLYMGIPILVRQHLYIEMPPGPWFNIKMSYQCRKSHCGDKTVVGSSYLHNGISYTGKMASLYWFSPLGPPHTIKTLSKYKDFHYQIKQLWDCLIFMMGVQNSLTVVCFSIMIPWQSENLSKGYSHHCNGLMQDRRNSRALAMELCFSCINPSITFCHRLTHEVTHILVRFLLNVIWLTKVTRNQCQAENLQRKHILKFCSALVKIHNHQWT